MSLRSIVRAGASSLPFYGPGGQGRGSWRFLLPGSRIDYEKIAGRKYDNAIVAACIGWLSRTFLESDLVIERPTVAQDGSRRWEPVPHALDALIERPNEWYDDTVLWAGTVLSLITDGNGYWYVERVSRVGEPKALVYLPHTTVEPVSDRDNRDGSKLITHYEYTPINGGATVSLEREDVVHFRLGVDPANPRKGLSPLAAALREIASENEGATFSAAVLRNMGIPGAVLITKEPMSDSDFTPNKFQLVKDGWENLTGENRGRMAIIPVPGDLKTLGMTPKELALGEMRSIPVGRICASIGIDPIVLGYESKNKTYANYDAAKQGAYESVLIPIKRAIASQLTSQLLGRFGDTSLRVGWDYSQVRVMQDDQDALFARWVSAYAQGVAKRSDARSALGLTVEPADEVYASAPSEGETDTDEEPTKRLRREIGRLARADRKRAESLQIEPEVE